MNQPYETRSGELYAKRRSSLKEGYIVRYADDFKILCRDWRTAQKWYHAVRLYLKDRLKLNISPEKSQIVNLRKRESEFLGRGFRTFKLANVYLYPLADIKARNTMSFSQSLTFYTVEGRERIHKKLRPDIQHEVALLMKSNLPNRSIEYMDNRISRYSMKMGKCEITGIHLFAADVHCHHYVPSHLGGSDKFNNLRILHKEVHRLIHASIKETIDLLITKLSITEPLVNMINQYRNKCRLEPIKLILFHE